MCMKRSSVTGMVHGIVRGKHVRLDPCLRREIEELNNRHYIWTVACCCGHGKYPKTILFKDEHGRIIEYWTDIIIPRTRNFYRQDPNGFFFVPEVMERKL
mgnify:CR=1 FL=1